MTVRHARVEREKSDFRFTLIIPHLDIHRGRMMAVLGPSGCGKSTLLDMLALILRPAKAQAFHMYLDSGRSKLDLFQASDVRLSAIRGSHIGYVLQSGGLLSFLSVRDNILLPGRLLGVPEKILDACLKALVSRLGIAGQLNKKPQHLSGGQRQRTAIARALITRPAIVFADEPTAAVDQETAWEICQIFHSLAKDMGTALVTVSHDQMLMRQFCDDVVEFSVHHRSPSDIEATVNVLEGMHEQ